MSNLWITHFRLPKHACKRTEGFAWPVKNLNYLVISVLVYSMWFLRPKCPEWLESSMQSNLGRYDLQYGALT